jgi:hypothetical protein
VFSEVRRHPRATVVGSSLPYCSARGWGNAPKPCSAKRPEALLSEVFQMEEWLESVDGQADELRVRRAELHRNELEEQLRFNRTRMDLIRDELLEDKDGTT